MITGLTCREYQDYALRVTANSVTGIGVPNPYRPHRPSNIVDGFFVRAVQFPSFGRLDGGLFGGAGEPVGRYANAVQSPSLIGVRAGGFDLYRRSFIMENRTQVARTVAVELIDGQPTTTSLDVATHFGKLHKDILKRIRNLLGELPKGYERNFAPIQISVDLGQGRTRQDTAYRMTRKGFTLLAFGLTGSRALEFKVAYIDAFDQLEQQVAKQAAAPLEHVPADEDMIMLHYNRRPLTVYRLRDTFWYRASHLAHLLGLRDGHALSRSLPPEELLTVQEGNQKANMLSHRAMLASIGRLKRDEAEALLAWLQMVIPGAFMPAEAAAPAALPRTARVLVAFGPNGEVQSKPVADDACVIRPQDLAGWLSDPACGPALIELPAIIQACAKRLDAAVCLPHLKERRA